MKKSLWLLGAIVLLFAITPALAQKGEPPPTPAGPPPKSAPPPTPTQPQPTGAANTSTDLPTPVPAKPTPPPTPTLPAVTGKPTVPPRPTSAPRVTREEPILPAPVSGPAAQPSPMALPTRTRVPIVLLASPSPVSLTAVQTASPTNAAVAGRVQEAEVGGVPTALNGQAKAVTDAITGGSVLVVIGLLAVNLFASFSQSAAVHALERTYRRQKSQEFELAMARELQERQEHVDQQLKSNPDAWHAVTSQLFADAGLDVSPSYIEEVAAYPCPRLAVAGSDGLLYVFATEPKWVKQRSRVIALDSSLSHFARIEAHTMWHHAAEHLSESITLPRDIAWYLVVVRPRRALSLTQRSKARMVIQRSWQQIWQRWMS